MLDGVTSGDFNADGNLDLATANQDSNDVSVFLGKGDGSFDEPTRFHVGEGPTSIVTDDFNRDNFLDLAIANAGSGDISLLLGKGDGDFQDETRIHVPRPNAGLFEKKKNFKMEFDFFSHRCSLLFYF